VCPYVCACACVCARVRVRMRVRVRVRACVYVMRLTRSPPLVERFVAIGVAIGVAIRVAIGVAIGDAGSACHASIVCGWPDGHILLFQQTQDEEGTVEWVLGCAGSRFWQAHPSKVTCVTYARADTFCHSHGCHEGMIIRYACQKSLKNACQKSLKNACQKSPIALKTALMTWAYLGMIISGDDLGNIKAWRIELREPRPEGAPPPPKPSPKKPEPLQEMASLALSLYSFHDSLHPRGPVSPRSRARAAEDEDAMVDVSVNPLDPPVALKLCARRLDYLPGAEGVLLIGAHAKRALQMLKEPYKY
jgi:hypothetical protein